MKRILSLLIISVVLLSNFELKAQDESAVEEVMQDEVMQEEVAEANFTQELKNRFIEGGPGFMGIVLACLIFGLAIAIERIIYLNLATTNTQKLTE